MESKYRLKPLQRIAQIEALGKMKLPAAGIFKERCD
jgi:hypothetical protein